MDKSGVVTVAKFMAPGTIFANDFTREFQPGEHIEWPDRAYCCKLGRQTVQIVGDEVLRGAVKWDPRTFYHPLSIIQTIDQVKRNPSASEILVRNMECNRWDRVVWSRWQNWPQPYNATKDVVCDRPLEEYL